jgi:hypothetical protein
MDMTPLCCSLDAVSSVLSEYRLGGMGSVGWIKYEIDTTHGTC